VKLDILDIAAIIARIEAIIFCKTEKRGNKKKEETAHFLPT
jgi:hypothetical protein